MLIPDLQGSDRKVKSSRPTSAIQLTSGLPGLHETLSEGSRLEPRTDANSSGYEPEGGMGKSGQEAGYDATGQLGRRSLGEEATGKPEGLKGPDLPRPHCHKLCMPPGQTNPACSQTVPFLPGPLISCTGSCLDLNSFFPPVYLLTSRSFCPPFTHTSNPLFTIDSPWEPAGHPLACVILSPAVLSRVPLLW